MKNFIFIGIFVALALSSGTMLGQVTAVDCTIDTAAFSSAIGYRNFSTGRCSFAAGLGAEARADYSFVFGVGSDSNPLISTYPNSFLIGFEQTPVFFAQSFRGERIPRVGIGTVIPQATLDVNGMTRTDTLRMVNKMFQYTEKNLGFFRVTEDPPGVPPRIPTLFLNENRVGVMTDNPKAALDVTGMTRTDTLRVVNNTFQYTGQDLGFFPVIEGGFGTPSSPTPTLFLNENSVGILTDDPQAALDVNGIVRAEKFRVVDHVIQYAKPDLGFYPVVDGNTDLPSPVPPILFLNENSVGVLTDNPKATLDVTGTTRTKTLHVTNYLFHYNASQNLGFFPVVEDGIGTLRAPTLFLNENRVGIMTDNPTSTLDVNGNIRVDTVKIKYSVFMPEDELSFTYYLDGSIDKPPDSILIPGVKDGDSTLSNLPSPLSGIKTVMTLKENKVGIGTTSPSTTLHVAGDGLISSQLTVGNPSAVFSGLSNLKLQIGNAWTFSDLSYAKIMGYNCRFLADGSSGRHLSGNFASAAVKLNTDGSIQLCTTPYKAGPLEFNYFTMLNDGKVGIGTTNPKYELDVNGDANSDNVHTNNIYFHDTEMRIAKKGTGLPPITDDMDSTDGSDLEENPEDDTKGGPEDGLGEGSELGQTYTIDIVTIKSNGKVGIGTTSPEATLHVNGSIKANNLSFDGGSMESLELTGKKIGASNNYKYLQLGTKGVISGYDNSRYFFGNNWTVNSANQYTRIQQGAASAISLEGDEKIYFYTAPDGAANSAIDDAASVCIYKKNLGIGTTNPLTKFQIGDIWTFYDGPNNKMIGRNCYYNGSDLRIQQGIASRICFSDSGDVVLQTASSGAAESNISTWNTVTMKNNGSVGIGTTNTGEYKLRVDGKINCTEVVVTASIKGDGGDEWPDYVFAEDYNLRSLDEVASYIEQNQRLPEIPSAAEVAEKGVNLLEINTLLLKKVEELTLYILDLQKQVDELKRQ